MKEIVVIDYNIGNVDSVVSAIKILGYKPLLTNNKEMEYLEKKIQFLDKQSLLEIKKNKFFLTLAGMILCDKITSDLFLV